MNSLDKAIKHYRRIVKTTTGNKAHFAMGALDILERVKGLRDAYDQDAKLLWHQRAGLNGWNNYNDARAVEKALSNLMEDSSQ